MISAPAPITAKPLTELNSLFKSTKDIGKRGEDIAADYLKRHNFSIILRNYRKNYGELDIIAEHEGDLVFIEVKTRTTESHGSAEEAVTLSKQRQIIKLATVYISEHALYDQNVRFDVISILLQKNKVLKLNHIQHAFSTSPY